MNRLAILLRWFVPLVLLLGAWPVLAEREKPIPPPPPQAVPQVIKVNRGDKAEIELKIYGTQKEQLQFLVRTKPAQGRLSKPTPKGREAALVTYEPPADLKTTQDLFTYAVQNSNGVSAAAEVRIEIIDEPVNLSVPGTIDFPAILAGSTTSHEIEIANTGGGLAEGTVDVPAPWRIEGSRQYHLAAGGRQKFSVIFAPDRGGNFEGAIRYTSQADRSTSLNGHAETPIALSVEKLELRQQPGSPQRSGTFEIANHTEQDQAVTLTGSEKLHLPKPMSIPAKSQASVTVEAAGADQGELRDEIRVAGAGIKIRLPVQSGPALGFLRSAHESIHFPDGIIGQTLSSAIEVSNAGGASGFWKWEIAAPFEVSDSEGRLNPGEKRTLTVSLHATEPGHYRTWLKFTGEQQTLEIPVDGLIAGGRTANAAPAVRHPATKAITQTSVGAESASNPVPTITTSEPSASSGLLMVRNDVEVSITGPTTATITWPLAAGEPTSFKAEERFIAPGPNRTLKIDWIEHPEAKFTVTGNKIRVDLTRLLPGTIHAIRFVPVGGGETASRMPLVSEFRTPPKVNFFRITPTRAWILALIAAIGFFVWLRARRA